MDVRFPYSPAETTKVELVQFGVLSPDEIVMPPRSLARPPLPDLRFLPFLPRLLPCLFLLPPNPNP